MEFADAKHIGGTKLTALVDRSGGEGRMTVNACDREERRRAAELRCSGEGGSRSAGHGGARERWCGRDGACRHGGTVVIQHAQWCGHGGAFSVLHAAVIEAHERKASGPTDALPTTFPITVCLIH